MNTFFLLMAEFETVTPEAVKVAKKYFDMDESVAKRKSALQQLPVPTFRAGSAKSPWLIHLQDLADLIDEKRQEAKKDHQKMHG